MHIDSDIDVLLDEFEQVLGTRDGAENNGSAAPSRIVPRNESRIPQLTTREYEIDNLLSELNMGSPRNSAPSKTPQHAHVKNASTNAAAHTKPPGLTDKMKCSGQGCNRLRCLKCDCFVQSFENSRWRSDVNYLFFRNEYGTDNVSRGLISSTRSTAQCCQCAWNSGASSWVCGGHV